VWRLGLLEAVGCGRSTIRAVLPVYQVWSLFVMASAGRP
jgi:hypothetical protein